MSNHRRTSSARTFYLELAALRINVRTDSVPELHALMRAETAALVRRVREHRLRPSKILAAECADLEAIGKEGTA